jgi:hypothetical protein
MKQSSGAARPDQQGWLMDDEAFKVAIVEAGEDERGRALRAEVCEDLALAFTNVGKYLWMAGSVIGPDRVEGSSPFGFGSDATVGLGTVVQIAGELSNGILCLLGRGNRYAAAALLRQLVEVEYLTWAFAENETEAMNWLRSDREERMRLWQPGRIRKRAAGRFRGADYALHCEAGGHPTPEGNRLLRSTDENEPDFFAWNELLFHGLSAWDYTLAAADRLGYGDEIRELPEVEFLTTSRERREAQDPLVPALEAAWDWLDNQN